MVCNEIELCSYLVKEAHDDNIEVDKILLDKYLYLFNASIKSPGTKFNDASNINSTTNN
jgi:hypothetical protein